MPYSHHPDKLVLMCRSGWHMLDVVPILQRLRWGHLKYAPLRYKNSPGMKQLLPSCFNPPPSPPAAPHLSMENGEGERGVSISAVGSQNSNGTCLEIFCFQLR